MIVRLLPWAAAVLLAAVDSPAPSEEPLAIAKPSAPTATPRSEKYLEAIKSVDAEAAEAQEIFRQKVEAGKEEEGWREDVKKAALDWLEWNRALAPFAPGTAPNEVRRAAMMGQLPMRKLPPGPPDLPPPASQLAAWLASWTLEWKLERQKALMAYTGELADFAEDVWLKAEKPADVRPVAAAFAELDSLAPGVLGQRLLSGVLPYQVGPYGEGPAVDPRAADAFYAELLMAGDDPLILPSPKKDLEGFTKARILWSLLESCDVTFQTRPRVVARIKELDDQYNALREAAKARLDSLILEDAASKIFEPALNQFNAFQAHADPQKWGMPASPFAMRAMPTPPRGVVDMQSRMILQAAVRTGQIHDYHDLLKPSPMMPRVMPLAVREREFQDFRAQSSKTGIHKAYGDWLAFGRARENGDGKGELEHFWNELQGDRALFTNQVWVALEKRQGLLSEKAVVARAAPLADQKMQPVADLIAALQAVVPSRENQPGSQQDTVPDGIDATETLAIWQALENQGGEDPRPRREDGGALLWQALAERPDCLPLFTLREKAARAVLAQLAPKRKRGIGEAMPIQKALEAALENCALDGDWAAFRRMVLLNEAASLLPLARQMRWKGIGEAMEQASAEAKSSPEAAITRFQAILSWSDNAAINALAVKNLKALSTKEANP